MESGGLVSDQIVLSIVEERIAKDDCEKGFILDGFPRTVNQAEKLDLLLTTNDKLDCVLRIKVDEEEIIKRLIDRAREDDKPDIIKNRFKTYNLETQPLIPFYENRKILFNINGMQEIEKVSEDIKKIIGAI
jgi:adenylate kinase